MTSTIPIETPQPLLPSRKATFLYKLKRCLAAAVTIYIVLLTVLYLNQRMLIFPGGHRQSAAIDRRLAETNLLRIDGIKGPVEEVELSTPAGQHIAALYAPALMPRGAPDTRAAARPTVIYFYGNGSSIEDSGPFVQRLREHGVNVLVPDYVGYGYSDGEPSEAGCYASATAAYDYIAERRRIPAGRIVLMGRSLGTGVAIDLASRRPSAGLITISAYTSMAEMACHDYPFVPLAIGNLLLEHKFLSEAKLRRVPCPLMIIHARDDIRVPFSMSGRLATAARGPVTKIDVPSGGHNFVLDIGGQPLYAAMARFAYRTSRIPQPR